MNQYPSYIQSNIKWAQSIPSTWKTSRVKYVSECLDGKRVPLNAEQRGELPGDYPYWGANGVVDTVGDYLFDEPLVLVGEDGAPFFDKLKDVAFNVDGKIWVNNHAHILRPKSIDGRFLKYVLNSTSFELYINGSTRDKLTQFELNNIEFPLPTREGQTSICNFLDRECERISGLVEEKKRFIDLLKEKRQALISHFVTKGLDANVPMKDSGVEWIGEVPEHWEVKAIKRDTPIQRGASPRPIDDPIYFDEQGEYLWTRIADVTKSNGELWKSKERLSELGASLSVKLEPGKLFLSIAGTVGKPCITKVKACIHDGFVYFPKLRMESKFLFYVFESGEPYKGLGKMGTQLNLNTDTVGNIKIVVPPREEQIFIVSELEKNLEQLNALSNEVEKSVALLQEHRAALISAAVTGKIDVREMANNTEGA